MKVINSAEFKNRRPHEKHAVITWISETVLRRKQLSTRLKLLDVMYSELYNEEIIVSSISKVDRFVTYRAEKDLFVLQITCNA
jgi:uncharacterized protein YcgI (DUF1989 family)